MRSNLRYGKNQKREDVKSHHNIISFDPRDGTDNGLTVDRAQRMGEDFCADESVLDGNGKVDVSKLQPITYGAMNHHYLVLGKKVGQVFHDRLALK